MEGGRGGGGGGGVLWGVHGEGEGSTLRRYFIRTLTPAVGSSVKSVKTSLKTRKKRTIPTSEKSNRTDTEEKKKNKIKSETRMTASVVKLDPNTKRFNRTLI